MAAIPKPGGAISARTVALTALAMLAFAANSLLCRMALAPDLIDAASFSTIRMMSGAAMLAAILSARGRRPTDLALDWRTVLALFAYMTSFTFAYHTLSAGTGALILFGAVQLTMFAVALRAGEVFPGPAWAGLALAAAGLVYLVSPGLAAPDPAGAFLMALAGIAWGAYSLLGRKAADPLIATAGNFIFAVPLVLLVSLLFVGEATATFGGVALAVASGAIASGCGYVVWYAALKGLSAGRAATVQLSVPAIAAFGGVLLLGEVLSLRLVLASVATIGGIAIVLAQRAAAPATHTAPVAAGAGRAHRRAGRRDR